MQDDEGPRLGREAVEATLELVAIDHHGVRVVHRREVDPLEVDLEPVAPEPARLIDAGTNEQAVEPGVEPVDAPEGGQVAPGPDERLLDGVLGLVGITEDQAGGGIEPEDRGSCQRGKGVMIAPPAPDPRDPAACRPSAATRPSGRVRGVWRGDLAIRSIWASAGRGSGPSASSPGAG